MIISFTSLPSQLRNCRPAVESILSGYAKPDGIHLYVTEYHNELKGLPVKIHVVKKDYGPATKLLYALKDFPNEHIMTIDNDRIYDRDVVFRYLQTLERNPDSVISDLNIQAHFACYPFRQMCGIDKMFPEGFKGVVYPPHCFDEEVHNTDVLMKLSPKADDVWFYVQHLRRGNKVVNAGVEVNHLNSRQNKKMLSTALHKTYNQTDHLGWIAPFERLLKHYGMTCNEPRKEMPICDIFTLRRLQAKGLI